MTSTSMRCSATFFSALVTLLIAVAAPARVLMTQEQALASAFPSGVKVERQKFFLTTEQLAAARRESGVVFAAMKYWMKSDDPFAVVNHPWQPHVLSAHVLLGPIAVFAFGWTFASHMLPALVNRAPNRASGIVSMVLIVPMVASGYLMQ